MKTALPPGHHFDRMWFSCQKIGQLFRHQIDMEGFIERVQEKISRLKLARTRSVRTVLIHSGDPGPAIEASDYFDFIVDAHSWVAG